MRISPLNFIRRYAVAASAVALLSGLAACGGEKYHKADGMVWNTTYHITYEGDPELADSVLIVLEKVGKSLNVFDTTSLVSRVNAADSVIVDSHFRKVYNTSRKISKASRGMFDPTLSPLISAWGFGPGHKPTADTTKVAEILKYVGIDKTHLAGDTLVKDDPRLNFNFSGVAKGYGCDAVASMFKRNRVSNYLIEIGGEIAVSGLSPSFEQWSISIDRPVQSDSAIVHDAAAVVKVTDAGIATSGNYRNFHRQGTRTLGHTISPKTGRPVETDVISATVIAPTAMEADAAATACMAAGSEVAKEMVSQLKYECMLILADSTTWMTQGLRTLLKE